VCAKGYRPFGCESPQERSREALPMSDDAVHQQRSAVTLDHVPTIVVACVTESAGGREHLVDEARESCRRLVDVPSLRCSREERLVTSGEIGFEILQIVEQLEDDAIAEREAHLGRFGRAADQEEIGQDGSSALRDADREEIAIA